MNTAGKQEKMPPRKGPDRSLNRTAARITVPPKRPRSMAAFRLKADDERDLSLVIFVLLLA